MGETADDEAPDNLPEVFDGGPVDRLKETLADLDGPLSPSNAFVPLQAHDVGDNDVRPNPRARDLDYFDAEVEFRRASDRDGEYVMYDPDLGATYTIHADEDFVIDDISRWA